MLKPISVAPERSKVSRFLIFWRQIKILIKNKETSNAIYNCCMSIRWFLVTTHDFNETFANILCDDIGSWKYRNNENRSKIYKNTGA